MFNRDFYPTPDEVISRMLLNEDLFDKIVYEPHGGKGNIVDYVSGLFPKKIYATEIVPELRAILATKCNLLPKGDFLTVLAEDIAHVDYIIMNPPFSNEEEHLLHAWNIAPYGCKIISLCSSPMVEDDSTRKRKQIKALIDDNGYKKDFGKPFKDAERTTDVSVSCVWLRKPQSDMDFSSYFNIQDDEYVDSTQEGLMPYNWVYDMVSRYTSALMKFDSVVNANSEMMNLIRPIGGYSDVTFGAMKISRGNYTTVEHVSREQFAIELQKSAWREVVERSKIRKYVTSSVLDELDRNIEQQLTVKFSMRNIYNFIHMVVGTSGERFNKVIVDAFMKICSHSKDNHTGGEGWRTNSDYMVNRKFIIPRMCNFETYYRDERVRLHVGQYRMLDDIEKAMCYLTATDYDSLLIDENKTYPCHNSLSNFIDKYKPEWGQWFEWNKFFRCKGYKKGTMHFEFVDEDVWHKFNTTVAKAQGWKNTLPKQQQKKNRKNHEKIL